MPVNTRDAFSAAVFVRTAGGRPRAEGCFVWWREPAPDAARKSWRTTRLSNQRTDEHVTLCAATRVAQVASSSSSSSAHKRARLSRVIMLSRQYSHLARVITMTGHPDESTVSLNARSQLHVATIDPLGCCPMAVGTSENGISEK